MDAAAGGAIVGTTRAATDEVSGTAVVEVDTSTGGASADVEACAARLLWARAASTMLRLPPTERKLDAGSMLSPFWS